MKPPRSLGLRLCLLARVDRRVLGLDYGSLGRSGLSPGRKINPPSSQEINAERHSREKNNGRGGGKRGTDGRTEERARFYVVRNGLVPCAVWDRNARRNIEGNSGVPAVPCRAVLPFLLRAIDNISTGKDAGSAEAEHWHDTTSPQATETSASRRPFSPRSSSVQVCLCSAACLLFGSQPTPIHPSRQGRPRKRNQ